MKMNAAVFEGAGRRLAIRQIHVPRPGPGQLLVRVKRCGVCGSDLHLTEAHAAWQVPHGTVLGHEFAGEIVELGEGTADLWREGDRVAALPYVGCGRCRECLNGYPFHCPDTLSLATGDLIGAFSEYAVIGARETARVSEHLSWEQAAFTEPVAVGIRAVACAGITLGARVLIVGAGPIGLSAAACAKLSGAGAVVVCARTDRHADRAVAMGATEFLLNDAELRHNFVRHAGGPPEIVIECAGVPGMLDLCCDLAEKRGRVVVAGGCNGKDPLNVLTPLCKELTFRFAVCYTIREFALAERLIASGQIDPMPMYDGEVSLHQLPARFEELRRNKDACKLMVNLDA